jgi:glutathione S-transferase
MRRLGTPSLRFKAIAAVLDTQLAQNERVTRARLSLADLVLAASLATWVPAKLPVSTYANLLRWAGRIEQLPARQAAAT